MWQVWQKEVIFLTRAPINQEKKGGKQWENVQRTSIDSSFKKLYKYK